MDLKEKLTGNKPKQVIPSDEPPTSNIGPIIALIVFVLGIVGVWLYNTSFFIISITLCLFIFMIDASRQLNYEFREYSKVNAQYPIALFFGGSVVLVNMLFLTFKFYSMGLLLKILIPLLVVTIYEYGLLALLQYNVESENIYIKQDPRKPLGKYYMFTESRYISLVEETALKKSDAGSNSDSTSELNKS